MKLATRGTMLTLAACMFCLAPGCAATQFLGRGADKPVVATAKEPAVEIVCAWQPARGRGPNGLPVRGLAGQLMFFTRREAMPVIVNGDVRVYLFDNRGTAEEQARPIHQQDFPAAQWQMYLQEGNVGPSYHIFVPYVRGGHEQAECSVQVRFTATDPGRAIFSELAAIILPGTIDEKTPKQLGDSTPRKPAITTTVRTISAADISNAVEKSRARQESGAIQDAQVQQASASVLAPSDPTTDRLDRVEQTLEKLLSRLEPAPLPTLVEQQAVELPRPERLDASPAPRRLRMRPAAASTRHPLKHADVSSDTQSAQSAPEFPTETPSHAG